MRKRTNYQTGYFAEIACMAILVLKGYRICAWRFRTVSGEIDIVAQKKYMLAFVEVKARPDHSTGMEAISAASRKRIENTASDYIQKKANQAKFSFRFDLMIVTPLRFPLHVKNIW